MKKHLLILLAILLFAAFLRLYKIDQIPVSLFGDELDVGYQAYSIIKTGKDYYGNSWPIHFHSLAEYRTPLYLYSAVPTVALFGISPLGVRLPAIIFGVLGIWGIYLLVNELIRYSQQKLQNTKLGLIAAQLLTISPWHLQYSRAGFEVTELLAFLVFGLYFFFYALRDKGKWLWLSVMFLSFTPWIYSTAKLFTPLLMVFLFLVWRKAILKLPKRSLINSILVGLLVGLPISYSTIFAGGAERAGYVSIFTDPTIEPEIGTARLNDAYFRGDVILGYQPHRVDKIFHNKFEYVGEEIVNNYLQTFSTDFLFVNGDSNPRHSIDKMGQFYKVEIVMLLLGFCFFFLSNLDKKIKAVILFWIVIGALPSELTRDGGNHATRLILILPPLIFLISYGLYQISTGLKSKLKIVILTLYLLLLITSFAFYLHNYYVHNPWFSERWWHAGMKEAFQTMKSVDKDYDRVIISMKGEPMWIFFAGYYMYSPAEWQQNFPIDNKVQITAFGDASHIGKYYFGYFNYPGKSIYDLGQFIDNNTLYLAVASEIGADLIQEPDRTPPDLKLIKAIPFPSGLPAYYIFAKK